MTDSRHIDFYFCQKQYAGFEQILPGLLGFVEVPKMRVYSKIW